MLAYIPYMDPMGMETLMFFRINDAYYKMKPWISSYLLNILYMVFIIFLDIYYKNMRQALECSHNMS